MLVYKNEIKTNRIAFDTIMEISSANISKPIITEINDLVKHILKTSIENESDVITDFRNAWFSEKTQSQVMGMLKYYIRKPITFKNRYKYDSSIKSGIRLYLEKHVKYESETDKLEMNRRLQKYKKKWEKKSLSDRCEYEKKAIKANTKVKYELESPFKCYCNEFSNEFDTIELKERWKSLKDKSKWNIESINQRIEYINIMKSNREMDMFYNGTS